MSRRSIDLEYRIRALISKQQRNGFTLDLQKAMSLVCRLRDKATQIESDLQECYPPVIEERYSDKTGKRLKDKIIIFNPASRQQIAQRLMEQGWQPNKKTEKGHPIVDESVLKEVDIPEAKIIAEYLLLQKRVSQVQSWIDAIQEDGKYMDKFLRFVLSLDAWHTTVQTWHKFQQDILLMVRSVVSVGLFQNLIMFLLVVTLVLLN